MAGETRPPGDTTIDDATATEEIRIDSHAPTATSTAAQSTIPPTGLGSARYQFRRVIGRGGMGEVVAATDTQIGREVAVKRVRGEASPDSHARFLREARIQGRLEHPAIVPVRPARFSAPSVTCRPSRSTPSGIVLNAMTTGLVAKYAERRRLLYSAVVVNTLVTAVVAWETSPFLIAPSLAAVTSTAFSFHPRLRAKPLVWVLGILAILVPAALEAIGAIAASTTTSDGRLVLDLPAVAARSPQAQIALAIFAVVIVCVGGVLGRKMSQVQHDLRCKLQLQAWHLRQIVPGQR